VLLETVDVDVWVVVAEVSEKEKGLLALDATPTPPISWPEF
jgi:hypothetical protein